MTTTEKPLSVLGVPGRVWRLPKLGDASHLWLVQKWKSEARPCPSYGPDARIRAEIRFDDECHNGHNSFAVTGDIHENGRWSAGGCLHDEIAAAFPELANLIKWHLVSSDGPMHYVANAVYHAGNRDHWGKLEGEAMQFETVIQFGDNPIKHRLKQGFVKFLESFYSPHGKRPAYDYKVLPFDHDDARKPGKHQFRPKYTFGGYADKWHECPFDNEDEALDFLGALQRCNPRFVRIATAWGEGKARDLDAARRVAVWPDASDEILCSEPDVLRAALEARLPALLKEFRADLEAAGFLWAPIVTESEAK